MRFLHTSDWHLGRTFHGISLLEDQAQVLAQIIALAQECKAEALLIAGDIYDRAVPPTQAVALFNATLEELILNLHLPVILIAGNHDNPDRLHFGQALFAQNGLYIYSKPSLAAKPLCLQDAGGPVYFAPLTYCEPLTATELSGEKKSTHEAALKWQIESMLTHIPNNARKVALAHAFVAGSTPCPESERPLAVGGSTTVSAELFADFNYTALGHLHAAQKCSDRVRYCGSLLKYSFSESTQKKTAQIVDLDKAGNITTEGVVLTSPHDLVCLQGTFAELMKLPAQDYLNKYMQLTLTDEAPILDAKHKLETVFPHVLELSYARLAVASTTPEVQNSAARKLTSKEMFENFFTLLQERSLSPKEEALLHAALDELSTQGRNA